MDTTTTQPTRTTGWRGPLTAGAALVLAGGLVAGIVVNKSADDRKKAERADQRPTAVTCTQTAGTLLQVNNLLLGITATNGRDIADRVQKAVGGLDPAAGTAFDRRTTRKVLDDALPVRQQLSMGASAAAVDSTALGVDLNTIRAACSD